MIDKPFFSICIPAYNRSRFLGELLDSICAQSFLDFEVIIAEDNSPERNEIIKISESYKSALPLKIILNEENLGYDKNLKQLIKISSGKFIFFLGNDDLLAENSLDTAHSLLSANSEITCAIRGYAVFSNSKNNIKYIVSYFNKNIIFSGPEKYSWGIRRLGVLSGLIFNSEIAKDTITDQFDGSLYYQTYLGIQCLKRGSLLYINSVLSYSRDEVSPDFGNSVNESCYTPGRYTPEARYRMISGVTRIYKLSLVGEYSLNILDVEKDYATYMLVFFKDQLYSNFKQYYWLWKSVGELGYKKYYRYHFSVWTAFFLKNKGLTAIEKLFRFLRSLTQ